MILQSTSSSLTIPGNKATVCLPFASLKCLTLMQVVKKSHQKLASKVEVTLWRCVSAFMVLWFTVAVEKPILKKYGSQIGSFRKGSGCEYKKHIWVTTTLVSIPNPNWASSNSYNSYNMLQPSPTQGNISPTIPIIPSIPSPNTGVINITNLNFMAILWIWETHASNITIDGWHQVWYPPGSYGFPSRKARHRLARLAFGYIFKVQNFLQGILHRPMDGLLPSGKVCGQRLVFVLASYPGWWWFRHPGSTHQLRER